MSRLDRQRRERMRNPEVAAGYRETEAELMSPRGRPGTPWKLMRDTEVLGTLEILGPDQPWVNARFTATPAFEEVSANFAEELGLLNADRMEEWSAAWERILALGLWLDPQDGGPPIEEFLLHIDGPSAWFRYNR